MATLLFFCSSVNSLGTHLAQTLRKPSLLWMMSYAEPWLISKWFATSSIVTHRFSRIMARASSTLLSVMDVDGRPALSSSFTLSDGVWIFLSIRIHFALVKHCPHIELIVFDGFQLLVHLQTTKKRITPRCFSLVHTESGAAILIVSQRKAKLCDDAETFHKRR